MKKNIIIIVAFMMAISLFSGISVNASVSVGDDIINNGGFEQVGSNNSSTRKIISNWGIYSEKPGTQGFTGPYGSEVLVASNPDGVRSGSRAICISDNGNYLGNGTNKNPYAMQTITSNVYPNAVYRISAWVKIPDNMDPQYLSQVTPLQGYIPGYFSFYINGDLRGEKLRYTKAEGKVERELDTNGWYQYSVDYTVPDGSSSISVWCRLTGTGLVYVDDVSVTLLEKPDILDVNTDWRFYYSDQQAINVDSTLSTYYNQYSNGYIDFSILNGTVVNDTAEGFYGPYLTEEFSEVYEGKRSIKIASSDSETNPYFKQDFTLSKGYKYNFSAQVKIPNITDSEHAITEGSLTEGNVRIYISYRGNTGETLYGSELKKTNGNWVTINASFTVPTVNEAIYVSFGIELVGKGIVYVDNASVMRDGSSKELCLNPGFEEKLESAYYEGSQYKNLKAWNAYPENDGTLITKTFVKPVLNVVDGTIVTNYTHTNVSEIKKTRVNISGNKASTSFLTSLLNEKEEYTLRAELYSAGGELATTVYRGLSKYARPSMLPEVNKFYTDEDGDGNYTDSFNPVLGLHVSHYTSEYLKAKEGGINVVQCGGSALDKLQECGMKGLIALYYSDINGDLLCAGNTEPSYIRNNSGYYPTTLAEATINTILQYRNHPALFGYMLIDEPNLNNCPPEEMEKAYNLIRGLDSVHPIYVCESEKEYYRFTKDYVDILATDPYTDTTTMVYRMIYHACEAANNIKTVCSILQTYMNPAGFYPDGTQERHMLYSSLLGGAGMLGFFSFSDGYDYYRNARPIYNEYFSGDDLWEKLVDFSENERDFLMDHFSAEYNSLLINNTEGNMQYLPRTRTGNATYIKYGYSDTVRWHSWTDQASGEKYVMILNQSTGESRDFNIEVNGIKTNTNLYLSGGECSNIAAGNGVISGTLPAYGTCLIRATDNAVEDKIEFLKGNTVLSDDDSLYSGGDLRIRVRLTEDETQDAKMMAALYKRVDDTLRLTSFYDLSEVSFVEGKVTDVTGKINPSITEPGEYVIKVFLWNSMKPIVTTQSFTKSM